MKSVISLIDVIMRVRDCAAYVKVLYAVAFSKLHEGCCSTAWPFLHVLVFFFF